MDVNKNRNELYLKSIIAIVDDMINKSSNILIQMAISGDRKKIHNPRHEDNFLSEIDMKLHSEYRVKMSEVFPSFIYASEEGDPQVYPTHHKGLPEFLIIVDPLDTSELAIRGLCGYTHILVYSLKEQAPIVSVVGDMFHQVRFFYAFRDDRGKDNAFLMTRDGIVSKIKSSKEKYLHKALVTNYLMRPRERFSVIAKQQAFLKSLARKNEKGNEIGRIGVDFGSIGLCHIAAGFTDGMIEIAKGFKLWDLIPGHYILHAAGGFVSSLDGKKIPLDLNFHNFSNIKLSMEKRKKFVAAGNMSLLELLLESLQNC